MGELMQNSVQVKAMIPRELKRQAFVAFAAREQKFSHWLRTQLEAWVHQVEATDREGSDERLAGSQASG
jgi:hypothetical protein